MAQEWNGVVAVRHNTKWGRLRALRRAMAMARAELRAGEVVSVFLLPDRLAVHWPSLPPVGSLEHPEFDPQYRWPRAGNETV